MPRETEADRIARERHLQNDARQKRQRAEALQQEEANRRSDTRKIIEEIPRVLQLLADQGYPNIVDLNVEVKVPLLVLVSYFVSPYRRRIKAGWYLGEREHSFYDGVQTAKFYLLSNGSICLSNDGFFGTAWPPQDFSNSGFDNHRSLVLDGLIDLRKNLEVKLSK